MLFSVMDRKKYFGINCFISLYIFLGNDFDGGYLLIFNVNFLIGIILV